MAGKVAVGLALQWPCIIDLRNRYVRKKIYNNNNNNNNNPICKAPECQKTSVALVDRNSRAN